jgi:hypothetical protein
MKNAKSMPYPLLVAILIVVFVAMRCVGEYSQGVERDAHIELVLSQRTAMGLNRIPSCGRRGVYFATGSDGLIHYWCGK